MVPCHPFSHLCVKSCFQPLQWQGFPYLPRDMATYSPHCEICPDFPSLNSSLLNFAPLLTVLPLWITANNNSATHILFLASHNFPAPRPAPLDERVWHETMREGFTQMFWIRSRSTPASPHPPITLSHLSFPSPHSPSLHRANLVLFSHYTILSKHSPMLEEKHQVSGRLHESCWWWWLLGKGGLRGRRDVFCWYLLMLFAFFTVCIYNYFSSTGEIYITKFSISTICKSRFQLPPPRTQHFPLRFFN